MTDVLRLAVLAVVVLGAVVAHSTGILTEESLRALFTESGPMGPALFVAIFSLVQPFGFPGILFMLLSAVIWPLWFAFLLNLAGSTGAGVVGFLFARFVGRDWVQGRLPKRLRDLEERVLKHAFRTVLIVRLTAALFQPAHWALGLSPVKFLPFLLASIIGFIPVTAFWTFAGGNAVAWLRDPSGSLWIGLGLAVVVIGIVYRTRRRHRAAESLAADSGEIR